MKNSDIQGLQLLLKTAGGNISAAEKHLGEVAWPHDTVGIARSIRKTTLALQQTINTVNSILEDMK